MYNESEKLSKFKNAVFDDAENQVRSIITRAQNDADEKLKKAHKNAETHEKEMCSQIDREEDSRAVREISSAGLEEKRRLLLHRQDIIEKVFQKVKNNLTKFQDSSEYENYLLSKVRECAESCSDEEGRVYLCHKDMKYSKKLSLDGRFQVLENETFSLGGVMVVFDNKSIAFDHTFDSAVEEEIQRFTKRRELILDGREEM